MERCQSRVTTGSHEITSHESESELVTRDFVTKKRDGSTLASAIPIVARLTERNPLCCLLGAMLGSSTCGTQIETR